MKCDQRAAGGYTHTGCVFMLLIEALWVILPSNTDKGLWLNHLSMCCGEWYSMNLIVKMK